MDTQRLILLVIFSFSLLMLWEAWEKEKRPKPAPSAPSAAQQGVPALAKPEPAAPAKTPAAVPATEAPPAGEIVRVRTDLVAAEIDTRGGTLKRVELLKHADTADPSRNFVLLGPDHKYEAQSGLTQEGGPNHLTLWKASGTDLPCKRARTRCRCG
jgi:YidC/Oxa1 family membrane protein insertase